MKSDTILVLAGLGAVGVLGYFLIKPLADVGKGISDTIGGIGSAIGGIPYGVGQAFGGLGSAVGGLLGPTNPEYQQAEQRIQQEVFGQSCNTQIPTTINNPAQNVRPITPATVSAGISQYQGLQQVFSNTPLQQPFADASLISINAGSQVAQSNINQLASILSGIGIPQVQGLQNLATNTLTQITSSARNIVQPTSTVGPVVAQPFNASAVSGMTFNPVQSSNVTQTPTTTSNPAQSTGNVTQTPTSSGTRTVINIPAYINGVANTSHQSFTYTYPN